MGEAPSQVAAWARVSLLLLVSASCRLQNPAFSNEDGETVPVATQPQSPGSSPAPGASTPTGNQQGATTTGVHTLRPGATGSASGEPGATPSGSETGSDPGFVPPQTPWPVNAPLRTETDPRKPCNWGEKACYFFQDPAPAQLASGTETLTDLVLAQSGLSQPAALASDALAPSISGLQWDEQTRVFSLYNHPRYKDQALGVEIWFRHPTLAGSTGKNQMVLQLPGKIWVTLAQENDGVYCNIRGIGPNEKTGKIEVNDFAVQTTTASLASGDDRLHYYACFVDGRYGFSYHNNAIAWVGTPESKNDLSFAEHELDRDLAIGGWVPSQELSEKFDRFEGNIYLVRLWNNLDYMRHAMSEMAKLYDLPTTRLYDTP